MDKNWFLAAPSASVNFALTRETLSVALLTVCAQIFLLYERQWALTAGPIILIKIKKKNIE